MVKLEIGMDAPDFTLLSSDNTGVSLKEFAGRVVVLYFYPKDFTPGCTKEACSFRDSYTEIEKSGAVVIGISYDSINTHKKFKAKYSLPFLLLSDTNRKVSEAYGVNGVLTAKRSTFVIGTDGKILAVYPKVDVKVHSKEILDLISGTK
ncbi:MAG: peroxiredoxin [Candidatus Thermoplasmatota archaeon]|jgi:peroxiredoxin Q/BCP|nr:peroxiredoxin [Candidatus Thermoplasmatota archaeon]MCL5964048.1 peroxiredoxin [Candidatus Thermoplasmatota archaeon]